MFLRNGTTHESAKGADMLAVALVAICCSVWLAVAALVHRCRSPPRSMLRHEFVGNYLLHVVLGVCFFTVHSFGRQREMDIATGAFFIGLVAFLAIVWPMVKFKE